MKIAVIGLGYVGAVTLACLASRGHDVTGVDKNVDKVRGIASGLSPISEPGLSELLAQSVSAGRVSATENLLTAINDADLAIVCVGTPSSPEGNTDLSYVSGVAKELGAGLRSLSKKIDIVLTSTVPPGTTNGLFREILERESKLIANKDFGLHFSPEFLREGTAIADFLEPEIQVIGVGPDSDYAKLSNVYSSSSCEISWVQVEEAECVKFASNAWHALKVGFSNEVSRFVSAFGVDSQKVMNLFLRDKKLNVSSRYLMPGFAFGGSCLPKDVRAFSFLSKEKGLHTPIINAINPSNADHIDFAEGAVLERKPKNVLVLGLAFKANTDDLRESPSVILCRRLIDSQVNVTIFDEQIRPENLIGANLHFITDYMPDLLERLEDNIEDALAKGFDLVVIAQPNKRFNAALVNYPEVNILDLTGSGYELGANANYKGLTW